MKGFEKATYTAVPNSLFEILGDMNECELKVVLYICRLTFGYHRDEIKISSRKIAEAIGMNTASVDKGGDSAVARGLLEKITDGNKTTIWRAIVRDSEFESRNNPGDSKGESPNGSAIQKVNRSDSDNESLLGVKESIKEIKELKKDLSQFEQAWESAKDFLKPDMPRMNFNEYVSQTRATNYADGILEVEVPSLEAVSWLESRVKLAAERYLIGPMNSEVSVSFVTGGVNA